MTLEPQTPQAAPAPASGASEGPLGTASAPERWLVVGPDDATSRRLAARLGLTPETPGGNFAFPGAFAASVPAVPANAPGVWDAVVYRPPRQRASPVLPDLAAAEAFFAAFAEACGGGPAGGPSPRLVLISSAAAVSPSHHHPGWAAESERPPGRNPIARAWLELEARAPAHRGGGASTAAQPPPELIVLRPVAVTAADGEDELCRLLRSRTALVPAGFDPTVQLLSPDDLAGAVECALRRGAGKPGIYHVAPAGAMPLRAALRLAGASRLPLGVLSGGGRLDYLRHSWTVSGRKIERELGFTPRATSAAAVAAELAPRRGPTECAEGAAGAAVAAGAVSAASELPEFDPYGLDKEYIAAYGRTLFRFLHDLYWRIEHQGLEHVPRQGRAVLTGVHRGFMPWDGVMALHLIARELGRHPRFLIHPCLVKMPFLANYMTKLGGILACQENADWVLGQDELLGMFPEGIHGAFTMYRDAYRLGKFGRDEYVKMALRQSAPIVPFVTVGSAEIYPILGRIDSRLVRRVFEWPFLPLAPNFPLPGLPLPSKWHTRFLEPLPVGELYPPEAAEDPEVVRGISREVRSRMHAAIQDMLARRKSIFRGSIFGLSSVPLSPDRRESEGGAV